MFVGPNVSCNRLKEVCKAEYSPHFRRAANSAAEPAPLAEASTYDSAVGQTQAPTSFFLWMQIGMMKEKRLHHLLFLASAAFRGPSTCRPILRIPIVTI